MSPMSHSTWCCSVVRCNSYSRLSPLLCSMLELLLLIIDAWPMGFHGVPWGTRVADGPGRALWLVGACGQQWLGTYPATAVGVVAAALLGYGVRGDNILIGQSSWSRPDLTVTGQWVPQQLLVV
jgi:hypothetical protein